jgi:hypothetical protein
MCALSANLPYLQLLQPEDELVALPVEEVEAADLPYLGEEGEEEGEGEA